jgi:hypothetical protein
MKTKQEIEEEVVRYFNLNIRESFENTIGDKLYNSEYVKMVYEYFDFSNPLTFPSGTIYDFAVWSTKESKFVWIEYPWRLENGDLTYNKVFL